MTDPSRRSPRQPHCYFDSEDGLDPTESEQRWLTFLRSYAPVAPVATKDLEDRILQSIQSDRVAKAIPPKNLIWGISLHHRWGIPVLAAASLLLAMGLPWLLTTRYQMAEMQELEDFLEDNWAEVTLASSEYL
ncbi:MAG: hypothetical protein NW237_14095 [Cyanobacteriota bacterium]|nr:hypothetical protein [Cyanobacteriota bacterium]